MDRICRMAWRSVVLPRMTKIRSVGLKKGDGIHRGRCGRLKRYWLPATALSVYCGRLEDHEDQIGGIEEGIEIQREQEEKKIVVYVPSTSERE
jgi:hypothetical protein